MKIKEWIELCNIISKYTDEGIDSQLGLSAEHDQIYLHITTEEIPEESPDGERLTELGFFLEYDSWSVHV